MPLNEDARRFGFDERGLAFFFAQLVRSFVTEAFVVAVGIARRDIEQLTNPLVTRQRFGFSVKLFEIAAAPLVAFSVLV